MSNPQLGPVYDDLVALLAGIADYQRVQKFSLSPAEQARFDWLLEKHGIEPVAGIEAEELEGYQRLEQAVNRIRAQQLGYEQPWNSTAPPAPQTS